MITRKEYKAIVAEARRLEVQIDRMTAKRAFTQADIAKIKGKLEALSRRIGRYSK